MIFEECVKNRRSIRKYKAGKIDHAVIEKVVEMASFAPSWKNVQTTRYIVVEDEAVKHEIAESCVLGFGLNRKNIENAPALVLVTTVANRSGYERDGSFSTSKETHWESFDAGLAVQTFCLAAHAEGLGTVIMGIYDEEKVIKTAQIPEGQKVSAMIAIGYPDEAPVMPKRRGVDELLTYI